MILSIRKISFIALIICSVSLLTSCTEEKFLLVINRVKVKNYPDTPFVYSNKINISGNINKDEETRLQENLSNYWSDSLFARRVQKFGISYSLKNPPVFDTANIRPTISFMDGYLFSQGYFNTSIKDSFYVDTVVRGNKPPQYRTNVIMDIDAGNRALIDSMGYNLQDSILQQITLNNNGDKKIEAGKTYYSKEVIAAELDRLVALYRQKGYFLMRRNNIAAVVDTLNPLLLQLTLDPFEQVKVLEQAQKEQQKPSVTLTIEQRRFADTTLANNNDTSFLKRFYVGNVYYYPEVIITEFPDSLISNPAQFQEQRFRSYSVYDRSGAFNPKMFRQFNYLRKGHLYNDDLFYKAINTFGQIGAWKQVDTRTVMRGDSVDIYYFLYPDRKQNITYNLEASRNTGDVLTTSNFFGLALNVTYRNRNVFHRAVQSTTSFTSGVEFPFNKDNAISNSFLQAFQISAGQTFSFPTAFIPFKPKGRRRPDFGRTVVGVNGSYADRKEYFRLQSLVADYGYDWKHKNKVWQVRFPNIEIYLLDTLPKLIEAFNSNPFLRNSFNTGRIISTRGSLIVTYPGSARNITNYARFSTELCIPGLNNINDRIYQYVKFEAEYRKTVALHKSFIAMRAFAGIGYNYHVSPKLGVTLPFYKQFIAGGPNSMRAWGLRQLGLGSSLLSDTSTTFRDRYGDMQIEANLEYRFPIAHYSSVNINGGLFADAGNIWNVRNDPNNPLGTFDIDRLGKDIALGIGTGLRLDFSYFLIRVDFGLKMRDPARLENNGWLDIANFTWRNHEFDKYDDQGNLVSAKRNNYAVQLGIGLPF